MECKEAKEWINRYTDEEIDEISKMKLKHHINNCNSCKLEYDEMMELHSLIQCSFIENDVPMDNISENIMKSIKPKNKYRFLRRSNFMKKKIIAASVMAVLLTISFIPINNTSLASTIKDWVSSVSFKSGEVEMTYISKKHVERTPVEGEKTYELNAGKTYDSIDEAMKGLEYNNLDFIYPDSIPKGYEFREYVHPTLTDSDLNYIMSFDRSHEILVNNEYFKKYDGYIYAHITRKPANIYINGKQTVSRGSSNIKFKKVKISGYDSVMILFESEKSSDVDIEVYMQQQNNPEKTRKNNYTLRISFNDNDITEDEMLEFVESYIRVIDEIDSK